MLFRSKLHAFLAGWERGRSPEFDRASAEAFERRVEFYMAVEKILTPAQRDRVIARLRGFGDDIKVLSERSAAVLLDTIAAL